MTEKERDEKLQDSKKHDESKKTLVTFHRFPKVISQGRRFAHAWSGLRRGTRWLVIATVLVALGSFSVRLIESPWRSALRGYDNSFNYFWARSLVIDGDWDFANDVAECDTLTAPYREVELARAPTATGRHANKYGVGWALASTPFVLAAEGTVRLAHACGLNGVRADGFGLVYQFWMQLGHFALAIASLFLSYRIVRNWADRDSAILGVIGVWAAGPLIYYQTNNLSMSHSVAFGAIALALYSMLRAEQTCANPATTGVAATSSSLTINSWWLLAGAGIGLAAITRFQLAIWGLLPLVAIWRLRHRPAIAFRALVFMGAGALPFIALQLFAWRHVYGSWLVFSYGENAERFYWLSPQLFKVLFSDFHGLYYCHPFLLIATATLALCAWKLRGWPRAGLVLLLLTIYVNGSWWCWWLGASFGNRGFEACMLFLMIGCAWAIARTPAMRNIWLVLISICFAANIIALALYSASIIPRNAPASYCDIFRALTMKK